MRASLVLIEKILISGGTLNRPEDKEEKKRVSELTVLVVEDEVDLAELIRRQLSQADMLTYICHSAQEALNFLENKTVDLILMDIILPEEDGFSLTSRLRKRGITIPIIFLTCVLDKKEKIKGLNLGGDDYITKPFDFPELIARIHAVVRRAETAVLNRVTGEVGFHSEPFEFAGCTVDPTLLVIHFPDGQTEKLGRKQLGILTCLYESQGTIVSRRVLLRKVWGMTANCNGRSLDQYVSRLRSLFEAHGCDPNSVTTVYGVGFRYQALGRKLP